MAGRLDGKVAIVTGATSGIGEAVMRLFAKEGAKVVFAGRRVEKGKALEDEVRSTGFDVAFVRTDVTVREDLKNLVSKTIEIYGKIDILINNAGVFTTYDSAEMDEEKDFDAVFNTNVRAYFLMAQFVLPHMVMNGGGAIVNTASITSELASPGNASYAASKGAIRQFTKSLAVEYISKGIRVNMVLPGAVLTEMVPAGGEIEAAFVPLVPIHRAAQPEEIAVGHLFLASDEASYCTGSALVIDGGMSII